MATIREIEYKGLVHAVVLDGVEPIQPGIAFVTPPSYPLQVGIMNHPAGTRISPHVHRDHQYDVRTTQEFIYVKRGLVEVVVYAEDWTEIERFQLSDGDFVLFAAGGHALSVIEEAEMIEVKQGPYPGDAHAKIFPAAGAVDAEAAR